MDWSLREASSRDLTNFRLPGAGMGSPTPFHRYELADSPAASSSMSYMLTVSLAPRAAQMAPQHALPAPSAPPAARGFDSYLARAPAPLSPQPVAIGSPQAGLASRLSQVESTLSEMKEKEREDRLVQRIKADLGSPTPTPGASPAPGPRRDAQLAEQRLEKIHRLELQVQSLIAERRRQDDLHNVERERSEMLAAQMREQAQALEVFRGRLQAGQEREADHAAQLGECKQQLEDALAQVRTLRRRLEEEEAATAEARLEAQRLGAELRAQEANVVALNASANDARAKDALLATHADELARLNAKRVADAALIADLQASVAALETARTRLDERARAAEAELAAAHSSAGDRLAALRASHESALDAARREHEARLADHGAAHREALERLAREHADHVASVQAALAHTRKGHEETIAEFRAQNELLVRETQQSHVSKLAKLDALHAEHISRHSSLAEESKDLIDRLEAEMRKSDRLEAEAAAAREDFERQATALRDQVTAHAVMIASLQDHLRAVEAASQAQAADARAKTDALEAARAQLADLQALHRETKSFASKQMEDLRHHATAHEETSAAVQQLEAQVASLQHQLASATAKAKDERAQRKKLEAGLGEAEAEIGRQASLLERVAQENEAAKAKAAEAKARADRLAQRLSEASAQHDEHEREREMIRQYRASSDAVAATLQAELASLRGEVDMLRAQNAELTRELDSRDAEAGHASVLQEKIARLTTELSTTDQLAKSLEARLRRVATEGAQAAQSEAQLKDRVRALEDDARRAQRLHDEQTQRQAADAAQLVAELGRLKDRLANREAALEGANAKLAAFVESHRKYREATARELKDINHELDRYAPASPQR